VARLFKVKRRNRSRDHGAIHVLLIGEFCVLELD